MSDDKNGGDFAIKMQRVQCVDTGGDLSLAIPGVHVERVEAKKPWEETWEADFDDVCVRRGDDYDHIFESWFTDSRELRRERAKLAAAAPELYRALESMVEMMTPGWPAGPAAAQMCVATARAALRKARGES